MTRSRVLFTCLVACLITATLGVGAPTTAPGNFTVGDFAALIASRMSSDRVARPVAAESAAEILKKAGVQIKSSLSSPLTEADAADLFRQFGITIQVQNPGAFLSRDRAEALVGVFGSTLTAAAGKGGTASLDSRVSTQSPGGATATIETATTVLDCQSLPRPPSPCDKNDPNICEIRV